MAYQDPRASMAFTLAPTFTSGREWFVSSVLGASGNNGRSWGSAVATIAAAIALASAGDAIYVAEDHAETVVGAAGIDITLAGVAIIGLGRGTRRPTITFGTSTAATVRINAANVLLRGFRFVNAIDSLVKMLLVNADDATIEDCDFIGASTLEFLSGVNIATTKDNTVIRRCKFIQPTDPAGTNAAADTGAIYLVDSENVLIEDCEFRGCFETGPIHNKTTGAANLWVRRCYGHLLALTTDQVPITLVSTATGGMDRCAINNANEAATTEATLSGTFPAGFFNHQTYFGNDGGGGQLAIASQAAAT